MEFFMLSGCRYWLIRRMWAQDLSASEPSLGLINTWCSLIEESAGHFPGILALSLWANTYIPIISRIVSLLAVFLSSSGLSLCTQAIIYMAVFYRNPLPPPVSCELLKVIPLIMHCILWPWGGATMHAVQELIWYLVDLQSIEWDRPT